MLGLAPHPRLGTSGQFVSDCYIRNHLRSGTLENSDFIRTENHPKSGLTSRETLNRRYLESSEPKISLGQTHLGDRILGGSVIIRALQRAPRLFDTHPIPKLLKMFLHFHVYTLLFKLYNIIPLHYSTLFYQLGWKMIRQ